MCVYCMVGDFQFKTWPPFIPDPWPPSVPYPPQLPPNYQPWPLEQTREYLDLLERVRELEDKLGCPCEPNKADYVQMLKDRIAVLEAQPKEKTMDLTNLELSANGDGTYDASCDVEEPSKGAKQDVTFILIAADKKGVARNTLPKTVRITEDIHAVARGLKPPRDWDFRDCGVVLVARAVTGGIGGKTIVKRVAFTIDADGNVS